MDEQKRNQRYANTVISIVVIAAVLLVIWKEDAAFIITLALESLQFLSDKFYGFFPKLFLILTIYIVFRLLSFFFIDVVIKRVHQYYHNEHDFSAVARMLKFGVWTIFTFLILTIMFQDNFGSVITSLGLVGFGITFALQKPILNFVGWLTISFRGIYKIGDRVRIGTVRGDVREIAMMNTVLDSLLDTADTRSGKIVSVPNELVLTGEVENYTATGNYVLIEMPIQITYESDFKRAQEILHEIASTVTAENKKILKKKLREETKSVEQTLLDLG